MRGYSKADFQGPGNSSGKISLEAFLPGVVLGAVLFFDHSGLLNFSLISVACIFSLVIFSFSLPSRVLIFWAVVYVVAIAVSHWTRRNHWSGAGGNVDGLVVTRTLVAAAGGLLACLLAKRREQGLMVIREINRVLDQMEIPVITSDRDGWLLHMNPKASDLLGGEASLRSPFFEHFSLVSEKGKSIKNYVDLATGVTAGPVSTHLAVGPEKSQIHPAIMLRVDIGERRQVMTLVYPPNPDQPALHPAANDE